MSVSLEFCISLRLFLSDYLYATKASKNSGKYPSNLYMLFTSDIRWTVLKIVYIRQLVRLQRHKVFWFITAYGGKHLKCILINLYWTKYIEITICHIDIQKHVSFRNGIKSTNILWTGSLKNFLIHYVLC